MRGDGFLQLRGAIWMAVFSVDGRRHRESTGTSDRKQAEKFLAERIKEKHAAEVTGSTFIRRSDKLKTIAELGGSLLNNLIIRGKTSTQTRANVKRVCTDLGHYRAMGLTGADIDRYIVARQEQGHAAASINMTLTLLKQSFKLAEITPPRIIRLPVNNARVGFFNDPEIRSVIANLPGDLQDYVLFAWLTGMRKSEIASLRWHSVADGVLILEGKHAKTKRPRMLPLEGELGELIERRRAARLVMRPDGTTELNERIFHRADGRPVKSFGNAWRNACAAAGLAPGKLFHDLRRSAARNMIRAGVPQHICMLITGHETASMFRRYAISEESDLREALRRTQEHLKTQPAARNVIAMAPAADGTQNSTHRDISTRGVAAKRLKTK
jgi:integrase